MVNNNIGQFAGHPWRKGSAAYATFFAQVPDVRRATDATTSFPGDRRLGTKWRERRRDYEGSDRNLRLQRLEETAVRRYFR